MCGRFALHPSPEVIKLQFGLLSAPAFEPHYNIAPTMPILVVRGDGAALARWGFAGKLYNARGETVAQRPAFRDAYRTRRCLIPASGFYEWRSEFGLRQPHYIHPAEGELFAFAGLWEQWRDLQTCTVITTDANEKMRMIHDRMPVIVSRADYGAWLAGKDVALAPCPDEAIAIRRVSRAVNNARNDMPELIEPENL